MTTGMIASVVIAATATNGTGEAGMMIPPCLR